MKPGAFGELTPPLNMLPLSSCKNIILALPDILFFLIEVENMSFFVISSNFKMLAIN